MKLNAACIWLGCLWFFFEKCTACDLLQIAVQPLDIWLYTHTQTRRHAHKRACSQLAFMKANKQTWWVNCSVGRTCSFGNYSSVGFHMAYKLFPYWAACIWRTWMQTVWMVQELLCMMTPPRGNVIPPLSSTTTWRECSAFQNTKVQIISKIVLHRHCLITSNAPGEHSHHATTPFFSFFFLHWT